MKALYKSMAGPGHIDLIERPEPKIDPINNVLVRVKACAICGMDHRIFHGSYPCKPPFIMGHEFIGKIEDIMEDCYGLKIGDRVTVRPHLYSCGRCTACSTSSPQFCKDKRTVGIDRDGAMTKFIVLPASSLQRVPDSIPDKLACIIEPYSMIYSDLVPTLHMPKTHRMLIIGMGQVGIMGLVAAKSMGVDRVFMAGSSRDMENRAPIAKRLGTEEVFERGQADIAARIMELTDGNGVDVVLEASGSESGIADGIKSLRYSGTMVSLGMTRRDKILIDWDHCVKRALSIKFHMQSDYQYMNDAIRSLAEPYADLSDLITIEATLSHWKEVFEYMDTHLTWKNILYISDAD